MTDDDGRLSGVPAERLAAVRADDITFVRRLLIVALGGALAFAFWTLTDLILLLFGAILIAVLLRALARLLSSWLPISERLAVPIALLLIISALTAIGWLFGTQIAQQMQALVATLPSAARDLASRLEGVSWIAEMLQGGGPASSLGTLASRVVSWGTTLFGGLASLVLVVFAGIYLALDPQLYRRGFMKLVPPSLQSHANATLDDCGDALHRWLLAQLVAMLAVGTATWIGLSLIGVPSALALGLIGGLAEFVPFVGPWVAALPALLLAGTQSWETVLWTAGVLLLIQQLENNVLMPLLASRTVSIAPAVGIFAIVAMGLLFGPLGLLLGFPLTVVADVAVRRLYVLDTLGESVEILGEPAVQSDLVEGKGVASTASMEKGAPS